MFRLILTLFCLTTSVSWAFPNKPALRMHCVFSGHLLHFLELNEQLFKKRNPGGLVENAENLLEYWETLRSRGDIVMAMLDELRRHEYGKYAMDLITVNLYINNIAGQVNVYDKTGGSGGPLRYDALASRKGLLNVYTILTDSLRKSMERTCATKTDDDEPVMQSVQLKSMSADCFKVTHGDDANKIRSVLKEMLTEANRALALSIHINTHVDFLPETLLMCDLIDGGQSAQEPGSLPVSRLRKLAFHKPEEAPNSGEGAAVDDGLQAIRLVKFKADQTVQREHGIVEKFHTVKLNLNAIDLKSYQQQVLMAAVYPVFNCIYSYLNALKLIHYTGKFDKFGIAIKQYSDQLLTIVDCFKNLDIFPYKVIDYINTVKNKLNNIVLYNNVGGPKTGKKKVKSSFKRTYLRRIAKLKSMCSKPMILNNVVFNTEDMFTKDTTDENCENIIDNVGTEVMKTREYVKKVAINKMLFLLVNTTVPHDDMFTKEPSYVFRPCDQIDFFKTDNEDETCETVPSTSRGLEDKNMSDDNTNDKLQE